MSKILTPETFTLVIGILISIAFELWPALKAKFDTTTPGKKFLIMSGVGLGFAVAVFGAGCLTLFGLEEHMTCDVAGVENILALWAAYFLGNQGTFGVLHARKKINGAA